MNIAGVDDILTPAARSRVHVKHVCMPTTWNRWMTFVTAWVAAEINITWRMLADNILASFTPGLVLVTAVCIRQGLSGWHMAVLLCKMCILSSLYTYVFDASNQAHGAEEDRINKPYRPIPAGLMTCAGAMWRFWVAMIVYAVVGWQFGVFVWVVVWQMSTTVINLWCPPRQYFWCKTLCMAMGVGAQLAQAWQLVTPIDDTGRRWIMFMAVAYPPPLIFEDIRDMAGDQAAGRRTLALMLGEMPIRLWFSVIMLFMPLGVYVCLYHITSAPVWRIAPCVISVATICWTCAVRGIAMRGVRADRNTYQLFISSYIVVLCSACLLWA